MSRSLIAKLFYGSLIAIVGAIVLVAVAVALAFASSSLVMDGPDVVGIQSTFGWALFAVAVLASLVIVIACVAQLLAWIGALIESAALENKTWFIVLLIAGLLGFGLIAILVYLLAEPGPARATPPMSSSPATV